jgi:thiamine kinase-like enzyme
MRPDPAQLAARVLPGGGPVELRRLRSGLVNETYRVRRDGKSYALRLPSVGLQPVADRVWECRVLENAARAGLAPPVRHCEPGAGVLVSDWVAGRSPDPHDIQVARIAGLMQRVHALEIPQPARAVTPAEWVALYGAQLDAHGADDAAAAALRLRRAADHRLGILAQQPAPRPVLCHGDVHRFNLVDTGQSWLLLDWEYSHVTDPYWDLASVSSAADWEAGMRLELLRAYDGCEPAPADCLRFDLLAWLYDYVCLAWSGLYPRLAAGTGAGSGGRGAAAVAARARLLAARLDAYPVVARANLRHTTRPDGNNGELNGADDRGGSRR